MPERGGCLYLVATPIGNLEDVTLRALRVLREVDVIAAEDTRVTRRLLTRHGIANRVISYQEFSAARRASHMARILRLLAEGRDVAVVSDAGMPGISDPGQSLVAAAAAEGYTIVPIPGPSAVITALAASGMPARQFTHLAFLSRSSRERRAMFASLADEPRALVFFESPHRLLATLNDLDAVLGDRQIVVARELTKRFEEFVRGTAAEARTRFEERPPRGEVTIVVAPALADARRAPRATAEEKPGDMEAALAHARSLIAAGSRKADAARRAATEYGVARRDLYRRLLTDR